MAEQERKVSDKNNGELLLPWKVEVCDPYSLSPLSPLFSYNNWEFKKK